MPPRPQPSGVRLPDRLRPAVQPLPGSAAPGDLRRVAQLRRAATEHRRDRIAEYAARQHTVSDHQARIRDYLKLAVFDPEQAEALERFVFEESCRLEQTASLLARAREFLKERRVLFPAESALLRLVGEQKKRAREHIVAKLAGGLSPGVVKALDGLLEVKEGEAISGLQAIKANPAKPSATAMQGLADKLAAIEATGILAVDLSWLNANYQRALFHYVRKCSADRLREAGRDRRLAALVCFLRQSYRDAVDQAVDMFDKLLTRTHTRAEHELNDQMRSQRQTIKAALAALRSLGAIILDDSVGAAALRPRLFAAVPRDALEAQVAGLDEWVTGKKSDVFHGLVRRFSHLRQFSPVLLRALEFFPDAGDGDVPCLEALRVLKEMNADLKRKLPEDAPTDFIPKRLLPLVVTDGKPDRKAWECALLLKLQEDLRSGNLSVKHGKRFGRFEDYFLPKERWEPLRKSFFQRSGLPADPKDVRDHLTKRLNTAYDLFLKTAPANTYATADEDGWHLSTDAAETLDAAAQTRLGELRKWLTKQMRTIRLPDLLIEVDNDLRFTDHFVPPAQRGGRDAEDVCTLLAVVLAHGCNIGLHTMAQITQGVTYKQLKRVSDWQMTEEAQRAALAALVHAISRLDTTLHWGEGRTSASDGQRFAMPRKVLQQTYSTRFSDFALEFYSFVADNYAPFYSTPIECTDRDSAFVLDGLLLQRERPGAGGALHRHARLHGDQLRRVRDAGETVLSSHPRPPEATPLPPRRQARLRAAGRPGGPGRPDDRPPGHRRAVGPDGAVLRVAGERSHDRLGRAQAARLMHRQEPLLPGQSRPGPGLQDRVPAQLPVRAAVAVAHPAGPAEGRATARAGPGRVLRPARADQRPRAARADELV